MIFILISALIGMQLFGGKFNEENGFPKVPRGYGKDFIYPFMSYLYSL
jgi:hypothetical protein